MSLLSKITLAVAAIAAAVSSGASGVDAAPAADRVTALPGWTSALPAPLWSGYVPVGKQAKTQPTGQLHYMYFQSESGHHDEDPVVLWLNGGPGASSLIGAFTENGPFSLNDASFTDVNGDGVPKLFKNDYGWTKYANMLFLEQPKGVGFSYCTACKPGSSCTPQQCGNTDETAAEEAYTALLGFFEKFPELSQRDFYITGESYAGVYIPMIMDQIHKHGDVIKLKGAAIGDGCIGNTVGSCGGGADADRINVEFFQGHAMYSQTLYTRIRAECGDYKSPSAQCSKLLLEMTTAIGSFNIYNIYDTCGSDQFYMTMQTMKRMRAHAAARLPVVTQSWRESMVSHPRMFNGNPALYDAWLADVKSVERLGRVAMSSPSPDSPCVGGAGLETYVCGGQRAMQAWLAQPSVHKALHVVADRSGQSYTATVTSLLPLYANLTRNPDYRMLIYSGDVDACVPYYGSEEWTRQMGYKVTQPWTAWFSAFASGQSGVKAGYFINYAHDFTFLTIQGAGHEVPTFKSEPALKMFRNFVQNRPYDSP